MTSKRPCSMTLSGVHVFTVRTKWRTLSGHSKRIECICEEKPNAEEKRLYDAAVELARTEAQQAEAMGLRRES